MREARPAFDNGERARAPTHIKRRGRSEICGPAEFMDGSGPFVGAMPATVFNIFLRRDTHNKKQIKMLQKKRSETKFSTYFLRNMFYSQRIVRQRRRGPESLPGM